MTTARGFTSDPSAKLQLYRERTGREANCAMIDLELSRPHSRERGDNAQPAPHTLPSVPGACVRKFPRVGTEISESLGRML